MGTELQRAGLGLGECGEAWNLTRPDVVRSIHAAYVAAGAECLLTNTFQAHPLALSRHGLEAERETIIRAGLALARAVAGPDRWVLADFGPIIGVNNREFENPLVLRETVQPLLEADAVLLETCSSPNALAVAAQLGAWPETRHWPVLLSLTYRRHSDGRLESLSGHAPEWFARRARDHGVAVLGVNCGRDMDLDSIVEVVRRYRQETDLPLLARPNAGTPTSIDGQWHYPQTVDELARRVPDLLAAGATLIGGCCGTTPAHIAACRSRIKDD